MLDASAPEQSSLHKWWAMLGVGLGVLMSTLDAGIVNIALPTLVEQLNTTLATVEWVILSYVLVITASMLGVARLGDMYGKKRLYLGGVVVFAIGSLLCGLAPNVYWLIAFRALQGAGGVMTSALGTAIITEVFPRAERGKALGIIGSVVSIGIAAGPTIGGILIGTIGWRWIFWVNVPLGIATTYLVWRVVPALTRGPAGQRFDARGAGVLFVTLSGYAWGMTRGQELGLGDPLVLTLLGAAAVGLVAFLMVESRVAQPMLDLSLFRNSLMAISLLMGFLVFTANSGLFILPFFLQLVQGYPTEQVGLFLGVIPVIGGLIAPLAGGLSDRFGSRGISLAGLLFVVAGCLTISTLHQGVTAWGYILRLAPMGLGIGLFQAPNNSAIMGAAPRDRLGVVSGLLALSRTLGQSTGLPLMGMIFTALVYATGVALPGGDVTAAPAAVLVAAVSGTFRRAAVGMALATVLGILAWSMEKRDRRQNRSKGMAR